MAAGQFAASPDNWRVHPHDQEHVLTAVLDRVGWVQEVIVSKRSGFVIDGHLRVQAALARGEETPVPFKEVDVSESEEALLLSALDPISAMAGTDQAKLDELVGLLPDDLRELTAVLRADRRAARKMVAFESVERTVHRVIVDCDSPAAQTALLARLQAEGYDCSVG